LLDRHYTTFIPNPHPRDKRACLPNFITPQDKNVSNKPAVGEGFEPPRGG